MKLKILVVSFLLVIVSPLRFAAAAEFSYKNLIIASIKMTPDYDYENYVDSYMQVFRAPVWEKSHNDEFELNGKRSETIDIMKKAATVYNLDDPMMIQTVVEFGEYDFKIRKFALSPFNASTFFNQGYCCTKLPHTMRVFFSNPDILDGIPMEPDAGKAFLDRHKSNGYVDRRLQADITLKLKALKSESDFEAEIIKIVIKDQTKGNPIVLTLP